MGRLENIIARNQRPRGSRERVYVSIGFGVVILVILVLLVFTDLGKPPMPPMPSGGAKPPPAAGSAERGQRVDGVLLWRAAPPAKR